MKYKSILYIYILKRTWPNFCKKHWEKWRQDLFVPIFLSELIRFCVSTVETLDHSMDLSFVFCSIRVPVIRTLVIAAYLAWLPATAFILASLQCFLITFSATIECLHCLIGEPLARETEKLSF